MSESESKVIVEPNYKITPDISPLFREETARRIVELMEASGNFPKGSVVISPEDVTDREKIIDSDQSRAK